MNSYPGQRRGRALGGKKTQERTTAGNTWNEQEDALFGPLPSSDSRPTANSHSNSNSRPSCPMHADSSSGGMNRDRGSHDASSTNSGLRMRKLGSEGSKKLSALTGQASSKISGILSQAKKSAAAAANHVDNNIQRARNSANSYDNRGYQTETDADAGGQQPQFQSQQQQSRRNQSTRPQHKKDAKAGPRSTSIPVSAKKSTSSNTNTSESPPSPSSFSFSFNTPADRNQNVSRMVQNVALSQIPMRCTHCHSLPLMFQMHPFFGSQRICSNHAPSSVPRCCACDRFQPMNQPFDRIGTSSALICRACARTAILDDIAATNIYKDVLTFLSSQGLDMYDGKMERIPIKLVSEDTLNQRSVGMDCGTMERKRGLCYWSEQHLGLPNVVGAARDMLRRRNHNNNESEEARRNYMAGIRHVRIEGILCLKGLPHNLMASILAHEATHAWFGLNPLRRDGVVGEGMSFGRVRRIDQTVEEGTCQLVAHLYLQYIMALDKYYRGKKDGKKRFQNILGGGGGEGPTNAKLNQYFKWSIENHSSPVYGGGFKKAVTAYQQTLENGGSLKDLFEYISIHRTFPPTATATGTETVRCTPCHN